MERAPDGAVTPASLESTADLGRADEQVHELGDARHREAELAAMAAIIGNTPRLSEG